MRLPPAEKEALRVTARDFGVSISAELRILAIEDREALERAALRRKLYTDKPVREA
jgi:hypothetical protein